MQLSLVSIVFWPICFVLFMPCQHRKRLFVFGNLIKVTFCSSWQGPLLDPRVSSPIVGYPQQCCMLRRWSSIRASQTCPSRKSPGSESHGFGLGSQVVNHLFVSPQIQFWEKMTDHDQSQITEVWDTLLIHGSSLCSFKGKEGLICVSLTFKHSQIPIRMWQHIISLTHIILLDFSFGRAKLHPSASITTRLHGRKPLPTLLQGKKEKTL